MNAKSNKPTRRQVLLAGAGLAGVPAGATLFAGVVSARISPGSDYGSGTENLPVDAINAVFGVDGTPQPGRVLLFDLGRSDVSWTIFGISVEPDWGFDTEITFQPLRDNKAIVKWELCLLDTEVNPVWNALRSENLAPNVSRLNALHNHFIEIAPEAKFMHGTAIGDAVTIAKALYSALKNNSGQPFESSPPQDTGLPNNQITNIIGGSSMISNNVLTVDVERRDEYRELGVHLEPASQSNPIFTSRRSAQVRR